MGRSAYLHTSASSVRANKHALLLGIKTISRRRSFHLGTAEEEARPGVTAVPASGTEDTNEWSKEDGDTMDEDRSTTAVPTITPPAPPQDGNEDIESGLQSLQLEPKK